MTTQLQTVLDALEYSKHSELTWAKIDEAISIVRGMMIAEPVAWLSVDCIGERYLCFTKPLDNDPVTALYAAPAAPQAVPAVAAFKKEVFATFKRMGMSDKYPLWVAVEAIGTETVTDPAAIRAEFEKDDYSDIVSDGGMDPRNAAARAVEGGV